MAKAGRKPIEKNPVRTQRFRAFLEREKLTQREFAEKIFYSEGMISGFATGLYEINDNLIRIICHFFPEYNPYWLRGEPLAPMLVQHIEGTLIDDSFFRNPAISCVMEYLGKKDFDFWITSSDEDYLTIATKDGKAIGCISLTQAEDLQRRIEDFRDLIITKIKGGK